MTVVLNIFMDFNYEIYSDLLKKQHFYNEIVDRCNGKSYNLFRKFDIEEKGDIMDKMLGGYQALQIRLLNGRIFQKLLSKEPDAQYRSEQGKILTILWKQELGCATATDIALATGLANNTLTSMVKKLEEQGLVTIQPCTQDKRKKYISLTDLGWAQKEIGDRVSKELGEIFYQGFLDHEIREFEAYQERIISNLKAKENDI